MMKLRFQQLTKQGSYDAAEFVECLFEWRDYGLVIPSTPYDIQVEYGDYIVKFDDGTYSSLTPEQYEAYMDFLDKGSRDKHANSVL